MEEDKEMNSKEKMKISMAKERSAHYTRKQSGNEATNKRKDERHTTQTEKQMTMRIILIKIKRLATHHQRECNKHSRKEGNNITNHDKGTKVGMDKLHESTHTKQVTMDSNSNKTTQQKTVKKGINEDGNQEEHTEHLEGTSQEIRSKTQVLPENNDKRQQKIQEVENVTKEKAPPGEIEVEGEMVQTSDSILAQQQDQKE